MIINKAAGFWLRLLSRMLDLFIVIVFISITAYFVIEKNNEIYHFKNKGLYYLWISSSAFLMMFITIIIPLLTKGRSIGNFLTRTKIVSKKSIYQGILYRELFFGIAWTILILLFMIILTPRIIEGVITKNKNIINLSNLDQFRFGIINTISGVTIFAQFIFAVSILVKKGGNSLIDSLSKTNIIRINKFISKPKTKQKIKLEPRMVKNNFVEWIGE